jgi:hypothetical protein
MHTNIGCQRILSGVIDRDEKSRSVQRLGPFLCRPNSGRHELMVVATFNRRLSPTIDQSQEANEGQRHELLPATFTVVMQATSTKNEGCSAKALQPFVNAL